MATSRATKASIQDEPLPGRLARLRKERGFTQAELADHMGLVQTVISDYERGKLRPNPDVLAKYAQTLGVSADEILGIAAPAPAPTTDRRFLRRLKAIHELPKRDQDALLRTIDAFLLARKAG